jgi:hypothetical protein
MHGSAQGLLTVFFPRGVVRPSSLEIINFNEGPKEPYSPLSMDPKFVTTNNSYQY